MLSAALRGGRTNKPHCVYAWDSARQAEATYCPHKPQGLEAARRDGAAVRSHLCEAPKRKRALLACVPWVWHNDKGWTPGNLPGTVHPGGACRQQAARTEYPSWVTVGVGEGLS